MIRIAVLGDIDSIKGFSAVGLDIFPCTDYDSARESFKKITGGGVYGVVYVTEEYAELLSRDIAKFDEVMTPAIIPIPGLKGNTGYGIKRLSQSVEKAVGSDIIFND
jgi:V/A-type H+-transporting ATPase subunit F